MPQTYSMIDIHNGFKDTFLCNLQMFLQFAIEGFRKILDHVKICVDNYIEKTH